MPCLLCERSIEPFMSFGRMPIANGFLTPEQFDDEQFTDLTVAFCERCGMMQLTRPVERGTMPPRPSRINDTVATSASRPCRFRAIVSTTPTCGPGRLSHRARGITACERAPPCERHAE